MRLSNLCLICFNCVLLGACATPPAKPSDKHIQASSIEPENSVDIPQPVTRSIPLPAPAAAPKAETYSVVVTNVPAQEILFALARDAKINLDIHNGIQGTVTINAINQTLPQILNRIAKQVDMRYELDGQALIVRPDSPYLKHYRIDYVNMSRDSDSTISDSTQVSSGTAGGNSSSLSIKNSSKNHFWETLKQNITDILNETDKEIVTSRRSASTQAQASNASAISAPGAAAAAGQVVASAGSQATQSSSSTSQQDNTERDFKDYKTLLAAAVISNPESGIITVRATGKQHEKIQAFIDEVMTSARRQVLIEVTVVEVQLSDQYQQGIDWSSIPLGGKGFTLTSSLGSTTTGLPSLRYLNSSSSVGKLDITVKLLETFGTVKVLSSPKLSVLNNQTAVIKVVDDLVYFTISGGTATVTNGVTTTTAATSTVNTVPEGFTMSVTPQINDSDVVLLNIKPSLTRFIKSITDPVTAANKIPQMQTREMESVLKIENNQIAVMGGLMEDRINNTTNEVPGLSKIPLFGNLFKTRNDTNTKTELVIFLRPVVIKDASLNGDYSAFRNNLPQQDFLERPTAESAKSAR